MHGSLDDRPAASAVAGETVRNRMRMVYIVGYGRSGSTVLDALLGNHPAVCNLGELGRLPHAAWLDAESEVRCGCGSLARECPFWLAVRARFEASGADPERYAHLSARLEGGRTALLALFAGSAPRAADLADWALDTTRLLQAISEASAKRVLIDSSKSPARARLLGRLAGLDLFGVHLVRDGRAVAWSLSHAFERDPGSGVERPLAARSATRTALAWSAVNRAAERALAALPPERRLRLRYEDYVADLAAALAPLEAFVGPGLVELARAVAAGEPLDPGHTLAGNRLRLSGPIELHADEAWRAEMPARERARVERWAGKGLARYGYLS